MLDAFKDMMTQQYEATLCTLNACVEKCPADDWNAPVAKLAFCQAVFHTLFYADYYLGADPDSFRRQPFHRDNVHFFQDYEELEDHAPRHLYDKAPIRNYVSHCRAKAAQVIAAETVETLRARCAFEHLAFSRAELYAYNIRHIQHHAAQLILRMRLNGDGQMPWVRSGWREV